MRHAKQIQGMSVVAIAGGEKLGKVDELVVSPDELRLLGFVMKTGGLFQQHELVVEVADIRSFGPDAITVDDKEVARSSEQAAGEVRDARDSNRRVVGSKVVSEAGALLGTVTDYVIDESSRGITTLLLGGSLLGTADAINADRVISVGPDAIVVRHGVDEAPES